MNRPGRGHAPCAEDPGQSGNTVQPGSACPPGCVRSEVRSGPKSGPRPKFRAVRLPAPAAGSQPSRGVSGALPRASVLRSLCVRAIRRFTIHPVLPESLEPLRSLMLNLRWSWHAPTRQLFAAIDPDSRELAEQDPVALLGQVPQGRLTALSADQHFLSWLADASDDLDGYLAGARWYQGEPAGDGGARPAAIAYFSPEYGITAALP